MILTIIIISIAVLVFLIVFRQLLEKKKYQEAVYLENLQRINDFIELIQKLNDYVTWVQRDNIKKIFDCWTIL